MALAITSKPVEATTVAALTYLSRLRCIQAGVLRSILAYLNSVSFVFSFEPKGHRTMRQALFLTSLFAASILQATTPARGDMLLSGVFGGSLSSTYSQNFEAGLEFTVGAQNLDVTSLGILGLNMNSNIGNPLVVDHIVSLWTSSGTFIESVTVPAGTGGTLVNGFYFSDLATPVTLSAGQSYVLGANYDNPAASMFSNDYFFYNTAPQMQALISSDFTYDTGFYTFGSGFPTNGVTGTYVGANLEYNVAAATNTPVPSTLVMSSILIGMFGAVWSHKRLKRGMVAA